MKELRHKVALITGGATGIGLALALELAKEPMKIVIASTNKQNLEEAAKKIREAGAIDVLQVVCDVSDRSSVENLRKEATEKFDFVDLLVCNAGVTTSGPFVDHRKEDWSWVYDVVLHGTVYCIQLFYPDMVKRKSGHIVLVGSQAGMAVDWVTLHGPYTSAKAAVMALGASLRTEAADHGVGVSNIIVAGTQTEIMKCERSRPERYGEPLKVDIKKREARRIPPQDVAEMIVRGIKEDKAWVATHPELKSLTEGYFGRILASYDQWNQ
jgi:NAD(P)-dependent dehydrogenase (short-subunit alcohol dehydrogenase family)